MNYVGFDIGSSSINAYESVSIPKDAFFLSGMLLMPFI